MDVAQIAQICHEANKVFCEHIGDKEQPAWADASDELKASAIDGVQRILDKPETSPEQSHQNWLNFKIAHGWKYGEEKDEMLKTHPCMIPYFQLPLDQRIKDHLFRAIVLALLPIAGPMKTLETVDTNHDKTAYAES